MKDTPTKQTEGKPGHGPNQPGHPAVPHHQPEDWVLSQEFSAQRRPAAWRSVPPETPQGRTGRIRARGFVPPRSRRAEAGGSQQSPAQEVLEAELKPISFHHHRSGAHEQVARTRPAESRSEFHRVPTRDCPVCQRQASNKKQTEHERPVDRLHRVATDRTDQQSDGKRKKQGVAKHEHRPPELAARHAAGQQRQREHGERGQQSVERLD